MIKDVFLLSLLVFDIMQPNTSFESNFIKLIFLNQKKSTYLLQKSQKFQTNQKKTI